jgi:glycosyltransferase involved in cell wall biosynthesis
MSKIIIVIGSLNIGGTEKHITQIAPELKMLGYDIHVISLSPTTEGDFTDLLLEHNINVSSPSHKLFSISGSKLIRGILYRIIGYVWLSKQLYAHRHAGIFHFFLPEAYCAGMFVSLMLFYRGKRILSRRSLNCYQQRKPLIGYLEKKLHKHLIYATANSKKITDQLADEGIPAFKIKIIYNGLKPSDIIIRHERAAMRALLNISEDTIVLVILANIIPYKGHRDLLLALGGIKEKVPYSWKLLCIGRDDGTLASLKKLAHDQELTNNVLWLGSQKNIYDFLNASDIGLLTSHEEGFSNAILECMAAKLPLVVTNVGGNAEAVINEVTGYVVPPQEPIKLGDAILKLILNAPKRIDFGVAGYARVITNFSLHATVANYAKLYKQTGILPKNCLL